MSFAQTLNSLMENRGITAYKMGKDTKISDRLIGYWKSGDKLPNAENLIIIAKYFGTSIDYLLTGFEHINETNIRLTADEEKLLFLYNKLPLDSKSRILERAETLVELAAERAAQEADNTSKQVVSSTKTDLEALPKTKEADKHEIIYYPYPASAGTGLFLDETKAKKKYIKPTPEALNADFAIPISGDSMEPYYSRGDIVLIESCPNVPMGKVGIFVLDGEVYIKEYGGDRLISYHEKYPPIMLKEFESAICLGRVLGKAEITE